MQGHFTTLDGIVLGAYFAGIMAVGLASRRLSGSLEGFTAAGRNLPGWLCGLSILGTYVSSISFLALPGKSFAADWNPFAFSLALPFATWIGVRWFLPFYRKSGQISAYTHLEARFGPWARVYGSSCYLITQLARIGIITYLMALPLNVLLGWDMRIVIILTTTVTMAYAFLGGIVAVIWTDAIQAVVLVAGALTCAVLMVAGLPNGLSDLFRVAAAHDKFGLGGYGLDLDKPTFWVVWAYGLMINLQNFGVDQNYVQRYHAASSDREAGKSLWLGSLLYIPLSAVFFFIGTALFVYYSVYADALAPEYRAPEKSDFVFPYFIVTSLPPGVTGLLIAAIFAAAMSTISSSLNSSATIVLNDYYRRYVNAAADERRCMLVLRLTTVVWAALGLGVALLMSTVVRSALDASWTLVGITSGGMLGLFLLGLAGRRVGQGAAICGVAAGAAVILWLTASPYLEQWPVLLRSPFHHFLTLTFATSTIVFTGAGMTLFWRSMNSKPTVNEAPMADT